MHALLQLPRQSATRSGHILGFNCTACGADISGDQARKAEGRCRACKRAGRTHDAERLQAEAWRRETTAAALERSRNRQSAKRHSPAKSAEVVS